MTVLVTGGSGLVGSHVIEALRARGTPVRALVRERGRPAVQALGAEAVVGDVTDEEAWRRAAAGVQAIVHTAALIQQSAPLEEYERVNVGGTRLAVAAARTMGAPLVHLSSVAVYGGSAMYSPTAERRDEDYAFRPLPPGDRYAMTKRASEALVREAADDRTAFVALRPNVIYGERDRLFTPRVLTAVRFGWAPALGPGTNHLACVYAGNVASAVLAASDRARPGFHAYNVTTDRPPVLSEREFIAAFAAAAGRRLRRISVPPLLMQAALTLRGGLRLARAGVSFLTGENPYVAERIQRELAWEPPFSTVEAVHRTVRAML